MAKHEGMEQNKEPKEGRKQEKVEKTLKRTKMMSKRTLHLVSKNRVNMFSFVNSFIVKTQYLFPTPGATLELFYFRFQVFLIFQVLRSLTVRHGQLEAATRII